MNNRTFQYVVLSVQYNIYTSKCIFYLHFMQVFSILLAMARWLSWLERRPVTAEVVGSNPIRVVQYRSD